jgi:hypothetical protein
VLPTLWKQILYPTFKIIVRGDQEGLFKLVTLDRILNRITGVTSDSWWLVVVNAIPISDICQINQQNVFSCSVINNRIKKFSQLYCQLKQSFLITRYIQINDCTTNSKQGILNRKNSKKGTKKEKLTTKKFANRKIGKIEIKDVLGKKGKNK